MPLYKNSKADVYYGDDEANFGEPCEVKIEGASIVLSYKDDDTTVVYEGTEVGSGHFTLQAPSVNGKATLHKVPNESVLEGWWAEDDYEGMWRIELKE